jgi:cytochrome c556
MTQINAVIQKMLTTSLCVGKSNMQSTVQQVVEALVKNMFKSHKRMSRTSSAAYG